MGKGHAGIGKGVVIVGMLIWAKLTRWGEGGGGEREQETERETETDRQTERKGGGGEKEIQKEYLECLWWQLSKIQQWKHLIV